MPFGRGSMLRAAGRWLLFSRLMRLAPNSLHSSATSMGCVNTSASSPAPTATVAITPRTGFSMAALTPRFVAARCFFTCDFALNFLHHPRLDCTAFA